MLWQFLTAKWDAAGTQAIQLPKSITPLDGLSERSVVEISPVPILLAKGAGSLLKPINGRHMVSAVGLYSISMNDDPNANRTNFFRIYLSNDPGTFIQLAVAPSEPKVVLESRLYQPYNQMEMPYNTMAEAQQAGGSPDQAWEFWLLDDPDPAIGGIIGCPDMLGKAVDDPQWADRHDVNGQLLDPNDQTVFGISYHRTWAAADGRRIAPIVATEYVMKADGKTGRVDYKMMHYGRSLDANADEFLLVAAAGIDGGSSLNTWLGINITVEDLIIYPSAT
jgi:hypothetical protein